MEGTEEGKSATDVREAGARGIQVERYPRCINKPTYRRPIRSSSSLERFSTSESAFTQLLTSYSYNTDTTTGCRPCVRVYTYTILQYTLSVCACAPDSRSHDL